MYFFSLSILLVGSETGNGIIKGLLGNSMFLGGLVACILDNTVRGKFENLFSIQTACKKTWRAAHFSEKIHFRGRGGAVLLVFILFSFQVEATLKR